MEAEAEGWGGGRGWNTSNPGVDEALQSEPAVMPRELSGSDGNTAIASRLFFCFVFLKNQEKNSLLGFTSTGGGACDTLS